MTVVATIDFGTAFLVGVAMAAFLFFSFLTLLIGCLWRGEPSLPPFLAILLRIIFWGSLLIFVLLLLPFALSALRGTVPKLGDALFLGVWLCVSGSFALVAAGQLNRPPPTNP